MIKYELIKGNKILEGSIALTTTKSISSRVLSFKAIHSSRPETKSVSEAKEAKTIDDTISTNKIKQNSEFRKAVRYIRAFFNYFHGDWVLSGIEKEPKGPVSTLVKKLRKEGIRIEFEAREGFPPLKVVGKNLRGLFTRVEGKVSGDMINASLLIAPNIPSSIILELKDHIIKSSYIELTLKALHSLGVNTEWKDGEILIEHEFNDGQGMNIETDWGSASYWYEMAAFAEKADFTIQGLNEDSVQPCALVKDLFVPFGVKTQAIPSGIRLTRTKRRIKQFEFDFTNNPDLIQTFMVTCIILKVPFRLRGITGLLSKYSEGFKSLQGELAKLGATVTLEKDLDIEVLCFNGKINRRIPKPITISTQEDHRLVMAFAPVAITGSPVLVENPSLTSKSYPSFWDDLKKVGVKVETVK